ncbi:MAG: type II secretion system F family protein [Hyphomicrobiales bacterium]
MFDAFFETLTGPQGIAATATATAVFITILVLARPIFVRDDLSKRMRSVSTERERIRARERARLVDKNEQSGSLRQGGVQKESIMTSVVKKFNLREALDDGSISTKLAMAGYRGPKPVIVFLFARVVLPLVFFVLALIYVFTFNLLSDHVITIRIVACLCVAYIGFVLPNLLLSSQTSKRQLSIQQAFPDALDLLLICVESGMSVEAAFKRVSQEMAESSPALAEEFAITTAELSFLQVRTDAYDNLAARTGLDGVKACALALTQAEKVGTPVGASLRVMAQENRDLRMNAAEHKAASLPPKLTVPMIIFFLPVLFMIIIAPAIIQLYERDIW